MTENVLSCLLPYFIAGCLFGLDVVMENYRTYAVKVI